MYFGKNDSRYYTITPSNISEPLPKVDGSLIFDCIPMVLINYKWWNSNCFSYQLLKPSELYNTQIYKSDLSTPLLLSAFLAPCSSMTKVASSSTSSKTPSRTKSTRSSKNPKMLALYNSILSIYISSMGKSCKSMSISYRDLSRLFE